MVQSLEIFTNVCYAMLYDFRKSCQKKKGMVYFMKAVITVTGKDTTGIIATVSNVCAKNGANIIDISQSVLKEYFAMIMLVEIDGMDVSFVDFVDELETIGKEKGLVIQAMHEDLFNSMHKI